MVSEMSYHSRPWQRHRREKHLAPAKLDLPIFKSMDSNTDITYMIWRFDVQSWLEQYTKESMKPHIYASLRAYPGRWVRSLEGREHLTLTELLQRMDREFGEVSEVDTMIGSMYEIHQVEKETVEEYMLCIHEAVVVIWCVYLERPPTRIRISCTTSFTMACCPRCVKPWALQWLTYRRGNKHALRLIPCIP